jgi:hypothetical protein
VYLHHKSLKRHEREIHSSEKEVFDYIITGCKVKFRKRSYLVTHLRNTHKISLAEAQTLSYSSNSNNHKKSKKSTKVEETSDISHSKQPTYTPLYEDISDDDDDNLYGLIQQSINIINNDSDYHGQDIVDD